MSKNVQFDGVFKTVKNGEGKDATYDLLLITKDGEKEIETKVGNNPKLAGAKEDARLYVLEKNPEATEYKMVHHKPGRERDAKEILKTNSKILKAK